MIRYPLLTYLSLFSSVLPISIGISKIMRMERGMKILMFYLIFIFAANILLMWFIKGRVLKIELFHFYYIVEYSFVMTILYIWQESDIAKRLFQALIFIYLLFWIVAKISIEPLNGLYSITATTSQVLLTLGAGYTLFIVMGNREHTLTANSRFWVLLSFVIYYAGTLLTIALRGIIIQYSSEKLLLLISIDWSLKIFYNILFFIGILVFRSEHNIFSIH